MRKAGRVRIAAAMAEYVQWRFKVDERAAKLTQPGAQARIKEWADDVANRIKRGELDFSTRAMADSTIRALQDFESGHYKAATPNGGFACNW